MRYRKIEPLDDGTIVTHVAVKTERWKSEWGTPTIVFNRTGKTGIFRSGGSPAPGIIHDYVGVYVIRWRGEWGRPDAGFIEVEDDDIDPQSQTSLVTLDQTLTACKKFMRHDSKCQKGVRKGLPEEEPEQCTCGYDEIMFEVDGRLARPFDDPQPQSSIRLNDEEANVLHSAVQLIRDLKIQWWDILYSAVVFSTKSDDPGVKIVVDFRHRMHRVIERMDALIAERSVLKRRGGN